MKIAVAAMGSPDGGLRVVVTNSIGLGDLVVNLKTAKALGLRLGIQAAGPGVSIAAARANPKRVHLVLTTETGSSYFPAQN
jgi:hypothetical protein